MKEMAKKRLTLGLSMLVMLTFSVFMVSAAESWRLKVFFKMTGETVYAHYVFDTKKACTNAKLWFEKVSAWHGMNEYECVLESHGPTE